MAAAPPAAPKGKSSGRIFGVPTPVVVGVGVLAVGVIWYMRKKAAATAAATAATAAAAPVSTGVAASAYGPAGGQGIGTDTLAAILASQGAGSTATSPTTFTAPTGETQTGAGFGPANPSAPITSASGSTFQEVGSWAAAQPLIASGQTLFYQPSPGVFAPAAQGGQLILPPGTNTPLFVSQGQSA